MGGEPAQDMVETIHAIDDIFLRLAETQPLRQWVPMRAPPDLPLDDEVEGMRTALESGNIHLTVSGKRLHVAPFVGGAREAADGKIYGVLDVASGLAFEARYSLWDSCLSGNRCPDAGQNPGGIMD